MTSEPGRVGSAGHSSNDPEGATGAARAGDAGQDQAGAAPVSRACEIADVMEAVGCVPLIVECPDYLLVQTTVPDEVHDDAERWRRLAGALELGDQFGLYGRYTVEADGHKRWEEPCLVWAALVTKETARSRLVIHERPPRRGPQRRALAGDALRGNPRADLT